MQYGTCRRPAVSPVKVPGVDAGLKGATDRVGSSLDVGLKEFSIQLSYSVHTHLGRRGRMKVRQQGGDTLQLCTQSQSTT